MRRKELVVEVIFYAIGVALLIAFKSCAGLLPA